MKKTILGLIIILSCWGCKKDKLEGEKEILIGKWKWAYSIKTVRDCSSSNSNSYTLTPSSENKTYSIEFRDKGCVTFYEDGEKTDKYRIVFSDNGWYVSTNPNYSGYFDFGIYLNNKDENTFSGLVKSDTLIELGYWFPFKKQDTQGGSNVECISYINYFVRE